MNTEERAHLEAGLSTTVKRHMEEFRKQREGWEKQRADELAAKRDAEAEEQKRRYEQLLEYQAEEAKEKAKSRKLRNQLLAALIAVITTGGGTGAYMAAQPGPQRVEPKEVKEAVVEADRADKRRMDVVESKVERLGSAQVEGQIAQSAGVEYIANKIDAASPKAADKVDEPPEVEAARIRADAIKKKKRKAEVLGTKYDPFEDLPKP